MAESGKCWEEVLIARKENRRELNLQGANINDRIKRKGLDENIFKLTHLNLLKIAGSPLQNISQSLGDLVQLTSLILENNVLEELPDVLGKLTHLKFLDVSGNKLKSLPSSLSDLQNLQSLNANLNELTSFPDLSRMKFLAYLSISKNKLSSLPEGMCDPSLTLLSTVDAAHNEIKSIPQEIAQLNHLTKLNVMANKLDDLPPEISECPKLKELIISENKMKDRKLLKLADHSTKSLLTYLNGILEKKRASEEGSGRGKKSEKKKKGKKAAKNDEEDLAKDLFSILRFNDSLVVSVTESASDVRPYIVCCVIRDLDFGKSNNMFKRFINIQTKLHEGVCDKRQAATIATHDLKLVKGPLVYEAALPSDIAITPLFKTKATNAETLMKELRAEADAFRKEKKKSTVSGIHKYLDLLKDKSQYPCLRDADGDVISFPPITNSEKTKISKETTDILVEVTSSESLDKCKEVMEQLLHAVLLTGVGSPSSDSGKEDKDSGDTGQEGAEAEAVADVSQESVTHSLTIEQVKVVNGCDGNLKVIYPSRVDLQSSEYNVIRNYE